MEVRLRHIATAMATATPTPGRPQHAAHRPPPTPASAAALRPAKTRRRCARWNPRTAASGRRGTRRIRAARNWSVSQGGRDRTRERRRSALLASPVHIAALRALARGALPVVLRAGIKKTRASATPTRRSALALARKANTATRQASPRSFSARGCASRARGATGPAKPPTPPAQRARQGVFPARRGSSRPSSAAACARRESTPMWAG